jgi:hypothetical protein
MAFADCQAALELSGKCSATFFDDGPMNCCAMGGEMIVAGGACGVYFLKLVQ